MWTLLSRRMLFATLFGLTLGVGLFLYAADRTGVPSVRVDRPAGPDQIPPRVVSLEPAPGTFIVDQIGLQEVRIGFDEPVSIPFGSITVWTVASGLVGGFASDFDFGTNVLTITLPQAIHADRVTIVLDYAITDMASNALDGEILDPANAALPSGDDVQGGQAVFRINVLQGDANRDGVVDDADGQLILNSLGLCQGHPNFDPNADLNGDGCVNVLDVNIFQNGLGLFLPPTDGVPPEVTQITPEPDEPLLEDLQTVELTFSEPIDSALFNPNTCFVVDSTGTLSVPAFAFLAPDGLSATYQLPDPLTPCETYSVNISNALADVSGVLLTPRVPLPSLSGLIPLASPVLDPLKPPLPLTNVSPVTIAGTAPGATSVQVNSPEGVFSVPVFDGAFSAEVDLTANMVNQVFFSAVSVCDVTSAPTATSITYDIQPPNLLIQFPANGAEVTTATTEVSGSVGDILSGFMGLSVTVNGIPASVDVGIGTNGTFLAQEVSLNSPGIPTVIEAIATDELGNSIAKQITVTQVAIPEGSPQMTIVSGNGQTAQVNTQLPEPLVVQVVKGDGTAFENKIVTFEVTLSDGRLTADGTGEGSLILQVSTGVDGQAMAFMTLGSDAGCGNNRVEVVSNGIIGTTVYCHTAGHAAASQLNIGSGNNQTAEAGAPASQPLVAWVNDSSNPVPNTLVTFTVVQGGGTVNGQSTATEITDPTGHAEVDFTFGPEAGPNLVQATFPGNPGLPASFVAVGLERDLLQPSTFSGLVLDNANRAIGGAECVLTVAGEVLPSIFTDQTGQFSFTDIPDGPGQLQVDGLVATTLDGQPIAPGSFPALAYDVVIVANAENTLPTPVLLPPLVPANAVFFDNTQDVQLTIRTEDPANPGEFVPLVEGLKFTVKAGSMTRADGSSPSPADPAILALNQVHFDEIPMPMPDGAAPPFAWTLQPAGAHFDPPVAIEMPNMVGLPSGAAVFFLSFNHDTNEFEIVASGHVSGDGSLFRTDPGAGISTSGWGGFCPPYPNTTTVNGGAEDDDDPPCQLTSSFFKSMFDLIQRSEKPCQRHQDGSIEGELKYRQCVASAAQCTGQAAVNTASVPGVIVTVPSGKPTLAALANFIWEEVKSIIGEGPPPLAGTQEDEVDILDSIEYDVPTHVPAELHQATVLITFNSPPPQNLQVGDGAVVTDIVTFDFSDKAFGILEVLTIDGLSATAKLTAVDPEIQPLGIATVGSQSLQVSPDGSFSIANVGATAGSLIRPRVTYQGVEIDTTIAPDFFVEPNIGGTTDFGFIPIEPEPIISESIFALAGIGVLEPGQQTQVTVTATLADGSQADVTPRSLGTTYHSSNPELATVDQEGLVTAVGLGIAFITATNEGATAVARIDVTTPIVTTDVQGFVQLQDGSPVLGAEITTTEGGLALSQSDGFFTLEIELPGELTELTVDASVEIEGEQLVGTSGPLPIVAGGITDAGIITLIPVIPVVFWDVDASGSWHTATNWSTDQVPGPTDNVLIDRPIGEFTITVSQNASALSVQSLERITLSGGTFTIDGSAELNNDFTISGGELAGSGDVTVEGLLNWTGGTMSGSGTTTANGGLTISGGLQILTERTLNNAAMATWSSGNFFIIQSAAVLNNLPTGTFDVQGSTLILGDAASSFNNAGTFTRSGSASTTLVIAFNNTGTVSVQEGTLALIAGSTNTGTVSVQQGTLQLSGGGSNSSLFNVNVAGTLRLSANYTHEPTSSLTGAGTVTLDGGTHAFPAGTFTPAGTVNFTNGTITINNTFTPAALGPIGASVTFNSFLDYSGALTISGTGTFSAAQTFSDLTLSGTLSGSGVVTVTDTLTWTGGTMTGAGTTTVTASGTLALGGGTKNLHRMLDNNGTAHWTSGPLGFNNGTFNNLPGSSFTADSASLLDSFGTGGDNVFDNQGSFAKAGTGIARFRNGVAFNNATTISVQQGTLGLLAGGNSTGGFGVTAGAGLTFNGSHTIGDGASVTGAGTLSILGGTTTFLGTLTAMGNLAISGGTANFNGAASIFGLTLSSGTLEGTGTVTIEGPLNWTGGTMSGSGTTTANGALAISGGLLILNQRTLNNAAMATWSSGTLFIFQSAAVLNNLSTGTFDVQGSPLIFGDAASSFNNAGTFTHSGSGITSFLATFNNTGTVIVQQGTLQLSNGGSNSSLFNVNVAGTLRLSASYTHEPTSSLTGAGTVTLDAGTHAFPAGTFTPAGTVNFTGGTITINNTFTPAALGPIGASVTFNSAQTFSDLTLFGTLSGSGDVTVTDTLTWTGGTMTGAGTTTVAASGTLALGGSTKNLHRMLDNGGVAQWTGGQLRFNNGTFTNLPGSSFTADSASLLDSFGTGGSNVFDNQGSFAKAGTGIARFRTGVAFNNAATISVQQGTLELLAGGSHTDNFAISSGATLAVGGGHTFSATSDVTGPGTLTIPSSPGGTNTFDGTVDLLTGNATFQGGTNTFNGAFNTTGDVAASGGSTTIGTPFNPATVSISGGTLTLNSAVTAGSMTLSNGTLTGSGDVTVTGPLNWTGGTMSGSGTTTANGGLTISGAQVLTQRTLNNAAMATWSSDNLFFFQSAAVLNNLPTGTFDVQGSPLIFGDAASSFNNAGTFTRSGSASTSFGIAFNNTGTVNVQEGTMALSSGGSNTGIMRVASAGTLSLTSSFTLSGAGVITIDLGGTEAGVTFGQVVISGTANLAGTLNIVLANGFTPALGDTFDVVIYTSHASEFTEGTGFDLGNGLVLCADYSNPDLTLTVLAAPCP